MPVQTPILASRVMVSAWEPLRSLGASITAYSAQPPCQPQAQKGVSRGTVCHVAAVHTSCLVYKASCGTPASEMNMMLPLG